MLVVKFFKKNVVRSNVKKFTIYKFRNISNKTAANGELIHLGKRCVIVCDKLRKSN